MAPTLRLLRPKQWSKNLLVFAALLFTGGFHDASLVGKALLAFFGMCALASAVYVFNDLQDVERDRAHPTKRRRPIASGAVSPGRAQGVMLMLIGVGGIAFAFLGRGAMEVGVVYLVLQGLYNWRLKRQSIADVFTIASGFVLRAALGAAALGVAISGWLLLCTAGLALTLGFAKRRQELLRVGTESREALHGYSRGSLDALVIMNAASALVCYAVYSLQSETARRYPGLVVTTFFVAYGVCRYLLRVFEDDEGGEPADLLFSDPHLVFSILGFFVAAVWAVSGGVLPFVGR